MMLKSRPNPLLALGGFVANVKSDKTELYLPARIVAFLLRAVQKPINDVVFRCDVLTKVDTLLHQLPRHFDHDRAQVPRPGVSLREVDLILKGLLALAVV